MEKEKRHSKRNFFLAAMILLILLVLFFSNRVFDRGITPEEDIRFFEIPHATFFVETIKQGQWPFWNPFKACGIPFSEISFMGPYYPFVILYFLFPIEKAVNMGFLLHIFMSALFMYILCRHLRFSFLISIFCASTWMLANPFQQFSGNGWLPQTIATAYFPLLIYLFLKIKESLDSILICYTLLFSFVSALILLGGNPHYCSTIFYLFFIFALLSLKEKNTYVYVALSIACALGVTIVYWGPLLLNLKGTALHARSAVGYELKDLTSFLFPFHEKMRRVFVGRITFIFGMFGLFLPRPWMKNLRLLCIVSLMMMFSHISILGVKIIDYIPFTNIDKNVWTWHLGIVFALIISAGYAIDYLLTWIKTNKRRAVLVVGVILLLQIGDLYFFNKTFYVKEKTYSFQEFYTQFPFKDLVKQDTSFFRVSNRLTEFPQYRLNQSMIHEIGIFESKIRGINRALFSNKGAVTYFLDDERILQVKDISNIKYVLTKTPIDHNDLKLVHRYNDLFVKEDILVYENSTVLPRAFILEDISYKEVKQDLIQQYSNPLLEMIPKEPANQLLSKYKKVKISYSPNKYTIALDGLQQGFVYLSEMYDKGWKTYIDGKPVKIIKPFSFFMGVMVEKGQKNIVFKYTIPYYYVFLVISLLVLLGCSVVYVKFYYVGTGRNLSK